MREIIHIGLGNCGVRIGCKFYEQLISDYNIETNRTCEKPQDGIEVHFSEIGDKKYVPRSILYSRDVEQILANPQYLIFNPNNYQQEIEESLRKEIEICDNCQGIQITHHLSTNIQQLQSIISDYSEQVIQYFTVFPNQDYMHDIIKSVANLQYLEKGNVIAFDNYGLSEMYSKYYKSSTTFHDYNALIATVMNGVTAPMRNNSNYTLQKMYSINSKLNIELCKIVQDKQSIINLQSILDSKLLIETDPSINDRVIQATIFARSSLLTPNLLHSQLSSKPFYNNIINLNYQITPYKQEILVSLLKSSHIKYKLSQMYKLYQFPKNKQSFQQVYEWGEHNLQYLEQMIQICDEILNTDQSANNVQSQNNTQSPRSQDQIVEQVKPEQVKYEQVKSAELMRSLDQGDGSPKKQISSMAIATKQI